LRQNRSMTHEESSYDPNNPECTTGPSIKHVLDALGPRTVEGDQGRWTGHTVQDAIAAAEYERKNKRNNTPNLARRILRSISVRLMSHDGRGS
jgi:hypothetical protein